MTVLDASAVLAYLQGEQGADVVARHLSGGVVSTANWAEVLTRLAGAIDVTLAEGILMSQGVAFATVTVDDARTAARLRDREGLSLADRLCLALAARLATDAVTADRAWGRGAGVIQIR